VAFENGKYIKTLTVDSRLASQAPYNEPRMPEPFDAVLLVAFGGPQGPADVRPFLENVLRGRRMSPERVDEVAHHYERFGGVSPLTELTMKQARALENALRARGIPLPVDVGMRNWRPYLADTLTAMSARGVRRAIGVLAAAQRTYSGCLQYKENVRDARAALTAAGAPEIDVVYVGDWHEHPGFIEANADHVRQAYARLPDNVRERARLIFTAHSIPTSMAAQYPYEQQLRRSAALIAGAVFAGLRGPSDPSPDPRTLRSEPPPWTLVFQSRSGRPGDPWLEPDVCDYLRAEREKGLEAAVLCPVGFLCDHVEVLYDLDVEAAEACRQSGIAMARAEAVNVHPRFIDALADAVVSVWRRYEGNRPVPVGTFRLTDGR
jgi:protoporphyrin/coproporphyrin ferrochelatase